MTINIWGLTIALNNSSAGQDVRRCCRPPLSSALLHAGATFFNATDIPSYLNFEKPQVVAFLAQTW